MKISISRLNYKNPTNTGGYYMLPSLNDVNEITDLNEVRSISAKFESNEDAEKFIQNFPKSFGLMVGKSDGVPYVGITFNTFFMNGNTGKVNETAIKKRDRFIKILKTIK